MDKNTTKKYPKVGRIAKFGGEMTENIAMRSLQILYIFVLRAEKVTIFELKSPRKWQVNFLRAYSTNIYKICKLRN